MSASQRYGFLFLLAFAFTLPAFAGDDFKPVSPEELALKDNPAHPGDHAMILELRSDRDDTQAKANEYMRIKVFTEEGRKYADVEIPYRNEEFQITDIKARTVHPDGAVIPFNGKVYDKTIVKGRHFQYNAATFTLSDVQPGSVLEYSYKLVWNKLVLYSVTWSLQQPLFIRKAEYKLNVYRGRYGAYWISINLPPGKAVQRDGGLLTLSMENVPPFRGEDFDPPERELKPRVEFFYTDKGQETPSAFWERIGKDLSQQAETAIGKRKAIQEAAATLFDSADPPETRLRKIYAKVLSMRNLSFERRGTAEEEKRKKLKEPKDIEEAWQLGYGHRHDLVWLFVGLARAAGLEAYPVMAAERDDHFFIPALLDPRQFDTDLALVRLNGKGMFLDPGTPLCPFGLLRWTKTGVSAMVLDSEPQIVTTLAPDPKATVTKTTAVLEPTAAGFHAAISISMNGQEALVRKLSALYDDETAVRKDWEDELKKALPQGSEVKLLKIEGLDKAEAPLTAEFSAELPDITSSVGSKRLLPVAFLHSGTSENPFTHAERTHPLYFPYPYIEDESITYKLPEGLVVNSLPAPCRYQSDFGELWCAYGRKDGDITYRRHFSENAISVTLPDYFDMRELFSKLAAADQESLVLQPAPAEPK